MQIVYAKIGGFPEIVTDAERDERVRNGTHVLSLKEAENIDIERVEARIRLLIEQSETPYFKRFIKPWRRQLERFAQAHKGLR